MEEDTLKKLIKYKLERLKENISIEDTTYGLGYKEGKIEAYEEVLKLIP